MEGHHLFAVPMSEQKKDPMVRFATICLGYMDVQIAYSVSASR